MLAFDVAHAATDRLDVGCSSRPDEKRRRALGTLCDREIDIAENGHRSRRRDAAAVARLFDDAYHGPRSDAREVGSGRGEAPRSLSNRILARPQRFGERGAHDDHGRGGLPIRLREVSSLKQGDLHPPQRAGSHRVAPRHGSVRELLDEPALGHGRLDEGDVAGPAGPPALRPLHPGHGIEPLAQPIRHRRDVPIFGVGRLRDLNLDGEDPLAREPCVGAPYGRESANEQNGRRQQNDGGSDLERDQSIAKSRTAPRGSASRSEGDRCLQVDSARTPRREQPEEQARSDARCERHEEHRSADAHVAERRRERRMEPQHRGQQPRGENRRTLPVSSRMNSAGESKGSSRVQRFPG